MRQGHLALKNRQTRDASPDGGGSGGYATSINSNQYFLGMQQMMDRREKEKEKKKIIEGVEIPTKLDFAGHPLSSEDDESDMKNINVSYNLLPKHPKQGETVYAYTNIRWNQQSSQLMYNIIEPQISEQDKELIEKIRTDLEERLNVDFTKLGDIKAKELLLQEIEKSFSRIPDLIITPERKAVLTFFIEKEVAGYGKIEALMKDPNIEDISCDGVNVPLFIYHRDPRIGSVKSNIMFTDRDELDSFVIKLAQKTNKAISIAEPLLDGSLPDGSRIQATLGTDIARKGSNFTIRKFTEKPLTPTHMLRYKTLNATQLAYLWLAIENGQSMLISGGTATGKTAMLNVLTLFIRPNMKVVSIEDTPELRLPLPHWVPHVARTPISIEGKVGEVSLFDLLKTSLRQRPDYIIVGEVRGKEAYVLFQQIATGHTGLATIHAANFPQLIDRLITPPISLPPTLLENISIIVFLVVSKLKGSNIRRANAIVEITGMENERPVIRNIFKWKPVTDLFETGEKSVVLKKISERLGVTELEIKQEVARRKKVLEWMLENRVYDFKEVAKIISTYYSSPGRLMDMIIAS